MPTLLPQRVSGLVVTPTVELGGGIYRVSLAIDVGVSRVGGGTPPDVVAREDLVVELRNPVEGSFEPIASPDPGPLPVRAIRVVQARAEFTYAQGVNPATELRVNLRGDAKSFPLSQTFTPSGCLAAEPQEGDALPGSPTPISLLLRPLRLLPPKFRPPFRPPKRWPPLRPRCCVRQFNVPVNTSTSPTAKSEYFEIEAHFTARARTCRCSCCEYRQYVRGSFTDSAGAPVRFDMPSGPLDPTSYCEDGAIEEFGAGAPGYYGHRSTSSPGDEYTSNGCVYNGNETPSCPPTDTAHLEFVGLIVDTCRRRVVEKRTWTVDL